MIKFYSVFSKYEIGAIKLMFNMTWFKNLKITQKILFSFAVGIFIIILLSSWGLYGLNQNNIKAVEIYEKDFTAIKLINQMSISFEQMDKSLLEKVLLTDKTKVKSHDSYFDENLLSFENGIMNLGKLLYNEKGQELFANLTKEWKSIKPNLIYLRDYDISTDEKDLEKTRSYYYNTFLPKINNIKEFLVTLNASKYELTEKSHLNSQELYKNTIFINLVVNFLGMFLFLFLGISTGKLITKPIMGIKHGLDKVTNGNFESDISYEYNDELSDVANSLNKMISSLKISKELSESQNWLKDGINQLSNLLSNEKTLIDLSNKSISFLSRYVDAGMGVLYIYDKTMQTLNLTGSYAFNVRNHLSNEYQIKEGIVGQVAYEKQTIILKNIPRREKDVSTGLISEPPISIFTMPLLYENELCGVLELSTLEMFSQVKQDFLVQANKIIATMINSLQQSERVKNLLEITQLAQEEAEKKANEMIDMNIELESQKAQMEVQAEELQETNDKMIEQQAILEKQAEEMRQANARMEEQQQELEQQAEELNQTNRRLMEQQNTLREEQAKTDKINTELVKAQDVLNEKAEQLERSSQYKSEFLANMSHELRTPLNSVILLSQLLAKNKKNNLIPDEVEKLKVINKAGKDLLNLINDILDLSKIEAGKLNIEIRPFNAIELLEDQEHYFSSIAADKGLNLIIENEFSDDLLINSDSHRLGQILRNFLSNAFKFTREGSVTLKLSKSDKPDKPLRFNVIDTGIGIAKDKQASVFEAFQQADGSTTRLYGGTGLGLSICVSLANLLGGEISLESEEGKGSNFSLFIPHTTSLKVTDKKDEELIKREDKKQFLAKPINSDDEKKVFDDRNNIKIGDKVILIIEDDSNFANSASFTTKEMGFKSLVALNGRSGIEMAKKYNPSGIILDLGLPDINGMEVLRELKSMQELRNIPVHIVSADDQQLLKAKKSGAIGFKTKPAEEDDLIKIIREMVDFSEKKEKKVLIVEDNQVYKENIMEIFQDKGIIIDGVESEEEAIKKLNSEKYDSIIIDLYLDNGSGYSLCKYIKEHELQIPVIIHTGKELTQNEEIELKKVSDSIVLKTVNSSERLLDEVAMFLHVVKNPKTHLAKAESYLKDDNTKESNKEVDLEGKKILIVDDDMKNIFVLTSALEETNAEILTAKNGKEGFELAKKNPDLNLIIMDIMMPVLNGYEATELIRHDETLKHIPIIAATAKAMKDDRDKCLEAGANDYITKPIELNLLIAMVEKWVDKTV